jgi:hypothetical protein
VKPFDVVAKADTDHDAFSFLWLVDEKFWGVQKHSKLRRKWSMNSNVSGRAV